MTIKKYRPSFSHTQLLHLLYLARSDSSLADSATRSLSNTIVQVLAPMVAKIDCNAIAHSHICYPKSSLLSQLGELESNSLTTQTHTGEAKLSYNLSCYNKYCERPLECSTQEKEAAKEYMYVNDLMSPEEEKEYEGNYKTALSASIKTSS